MHKAKNCIISCIDFRFQSTVYNWFLTNDLLGESDLIILAGASRDLVKPLEENHKTSLLRQISLSVKLHDPENILIVDHQDCGGYAQDKTIESGLSEEADMKLHEVYATKAKELLGELFPTKQIKTFYAALSGKVVELNGTK